MQESLPTESREIGKNTYTVARLGFANSRKLLVISERLLGPSVLSILSGVDPKAAVSSLLGMDAKAAGEALLGLISRLTSSDSEEVFRLLGAHTYVHDADTGKRLYLQPDVQDQWWALHPGECIPWLAFAYEVQYKIFFSGAASLARGALQRAKP